MVQPEEANNSGFGEEQSEDDPYEYMIQQVEKEREKVAKQQIVSNLDQYNLFAPKQSYQQRPPVQKMQQDKIDL